MNKNVEFFNINGIDIIGNFNNGAVIGLEKEAVDYLKNGYPYDEDKAIELLNALKDLKFYEEFEYKLDASYIHVNDRCNLHCIGCYSYVDNRNEKDELSYEEICKILDNLKNSGVKTIVISGGEPFLRDDIDKICKYAKEDLRIENVCTITNGSLNIERYIPSLKYIDEFNISIDGYNDQTQFIRDKGIMPKVIENIIKISEIAPSINLISTLHKKNFRYMDKYNELANSLKVKYSFSIFTNDYENEEFKDYILEDIDLINIEKTLMDLNIEAKVSDTPIGSFCINCRKGCEAGNKMISIDSKGDVYPCHMLHFDEFKLGSAIDTNIKDLTESSNNIFRNVDVDNINTCKDCEYKYICGGGCRGRSYLRHGNLLEKDTYCLLNYNFYKNMMENII